MPALWYPSSPNTCSAASMSRWRVRWPRAVAGRAMMAAWRGRSPRARLAVVVEPETCFMCQERERYASGGWAVQRECGAGRPHGRPGSGGRELAANFERVRCELGARRGQLGRLRLASLDVLDQLVGELRIGDDRGVGQAAAGCDEAVLDVERCTEAGDGRRANGGGVLVPRGRSLFDHLAGGLARIGAGGVLLGGLGHCRNLLSAVACISPLSALCI